MLPTIAKTAGAAVIFQPRVFRPILFIIILVIGFFVVRYIVRKIKRSNLGKSGEINYNQLDPQVNYDNYAKRAHDELTGWWVTGNARNAVAADFMRLNNDELMFVNDRYLELFGEQDNHTLYTLFSDYWICTPCADLNALLTRLKDLRLA